MDYPNIRRSDVCPFCLGHKARGLIACWPCYREEGLRNGENFRQTLTLETTEQRLITCNQGV